MAVRPKAGAHSPMQAPKGFSHGVPIRTAVIFAVCIILACFVWRVYADEYEGTYDEKKNVFLRSNTEREKEAIEELDQLFPGHEVENQNDSKPIEKTGSADAAGYLNKVYFDGAYEDQPLKDVEDTNQNTGTVKEDRVQVNLNDDNGKANAKSTKDSSLYYPKYTYPDDEYEKADDVEIGNSESDKNATNEKKDDPTNEDLERYLQEEYEHKEDDEEIRDEEKWIEGKEKEDNNVYNIGDEEAVEEEQQEEEKETDKLEDEDVIYVEDQGDAEIARAFPELAGAKPNSNKGSQEAYAEDSSPNYHQINAEDNEQERKTEAAEIATNADTPKDTTPESNVFDPLQSALRFRERMDALYTAQIEALNYRNYIFDGAQFVAQLRQSLLEELTRFREGWDSLSSLPLVESPPSVDVRDGSDEIELDVALPGTLRKFIRLELQGQQLLLSGTRERRCPHKSNYYSVVTFFHSFPVPRGVRSDDIRAQFDDESQVIHIRIRKPTAARPDPTHIAIE